MPKQEYAYYDVTFSNFIKKEIREKQQGYCFTCGETPPILQIHHKMPQFTVKVMKQMGIHENVIESFARYIKSPANGVGLCQPCHDVWNELGSAETKRMCGEMARQGDIFIRKRPR